MHPTSKSIMKNLGILIAVSFLLSGCGGGNCCDNTSSGGGQQSTVTGVNFKTSIKKTFETNGELVTVDYELTDSNGEDVSGTIFFGDQEQAKISGTGMITHMYQTTGTFQISIMIDGAATNIVGEVTIQSTALNDGSFSNCQPDVEQSTAQCVLIPSS